MAVTLISYATGFAGELRLPLGYDLTFVESIIECPNTFSTASGYPTSGGPRFMYFTQLGARMCVLGTSKPALDYSFFFASEVKTCVGPY